MNCDEVRELLGAYVLDAVSPDERVEIEAHLAECDLHEEVASLRAAAFALGPAAPAREPSPELEQRILSAALASRPPAEPAPRTPSARPARPAWRRISSAPALAAALAIVAIALGAWVAVLLAGGDDGEQFVFSYRGHGGESWLRFESVLGESPTRVALGGFERLEGDRAYHLWSIRDDAWLQVGVFNTNPEGRWAGDFEFAFEPGDEIALTVGVDAAGGGPEGEPLFRSPI